MRRSAFVKQKQASQSASDWSAAPVEVLRRAFELQHNALDNCAAACTCSAWRKVVNSSSIGSLYLYANSDSPDDVWTAFLKSRSAIDCLTLTRSATWNEQNGQQCPTFIQAPRTCMFPPSIPCKELHLSEHLARHTSDSIQALSQLQKLSLEWNGLTTLQPVANGSDTNQLYSAILPGLTGLTGLTELSISMRNDTHGHMFPLLLVRLPISIQRLNLEGFGSQFEDDQPPTCSTKLGPDDCLASLTALTHLALTKSSVQIPGDGITCLSRLHSLDLSNSEVYVDGQLEVSQLTSLSYLDLSSMNCYWEDAWVEAMNTFQAWPNLKVLKLKDCNIVDAQTLLIIPDVDELEVLYPVGRNMTAEEVAGKKVHAHLPQSCFPGFNVTAPLYGKPAVSLHLHKWAPVSQIGAEAALSTILQQSPALQSLYIQSDSVLAKATAVGDVLRDLSVIDLKQLELVGVSCIDLHLEALTGLTQLLLSRLDHQKPMLRLVMPHSLQHLKFLGSSLFGEHLRESGLNGCLVHNLQDLTNLTKLVLGPVRFSYCSVNWQPSLPPLPVNLRSLEVHRWYFDNMSDWSGLSACQHLEHLTLPGGYKHTADLDKYISSARCLHVVDEDTTDSSAWRDDVHSCYHGTRIFSLDEVPEWLEDSDDMF